MLHEFLVEEIVSGIRGFLFLTKDQMNVEEIFYTCNLSLSLLQEHVQVLFYAYCFLIAPLKLPINL